MMRVNEVISISIDGKRLRTVISINSCKVRLYSVPSSLTSMIFIAGIDSALKLRGKSIKTVARKIFHLVRRSEMNRHLKILLALKQNTPAASKTNPFNEAILVPSIKFIFFSMLRYKEKIAAQRSGLTRQKFDTYMF